MVCLIRFNLPITGTLQLQLLYAGIVLNTENHKKLLNSVLDLSQGSFENCR